MKTKFDKQIEDSISLKNSIKKLEKNVNKVILNVVSKLKKGGKVMLCGNGGSAADAQHLAAEFLVRLRPNFNRKPLPLDLEEYVTFKSNVTKFVNKRNERILMWSKRIK